jgi:hypothetical protein
VLRLLVLALAWFGLAAAEEAPKKESASSGASGEAARARAGGNASVEGGAALGTTGIDSRPAARTEQAEKQARRSRQKGGASAGASRDSRPGSREAEEAR